MYQRFQRRGMETLCEDVKIQSQHELVKGIGIDYVQGFYSEIPAGEGGDWLAVRKRKLFILAAVLTLVAAGLFIDIVRKKQAEENQSRNGLYSWNAFENAEAAEELFYAVNRLHAGEVYQYYSQRELLDQIPREVVTRLNEKGVRVWYLAGEAKWGIDADGKEIRNAVAALALYNRSVPEKARFYGIQLDVEPYLTEKWEEDKHQVMELWYQSLRQGKELAERYGVPMMICIPRWLDVVDEKLLEQMLRDCCDQVAIMNYDRRDEAEGIAVEMSLAVRYSRPVVCITELTEPGNHDLTEENSYYYESLNAVSQSWERLEEKYPDATLRFACHHLEPLIQMMEREQKGEIGEKVK